jgi:NAD(P)-dependent dehydrogenase (short-subunit alcohol dehydrogenase family)
VNKTRLGAALAALGLGHVVLRALERRRAVRLPGATAVVCGASRGLGRALALELARRGVAKIAVCSRTGHDLDELAAELTHRGVHACAEACDLADAADTERFIYNACARLGPIDILVANAATIGVGPFATMAKSDFDEALASTFYTALNPILAVLPEMRHRRRGNITLITSIGARVGVPHLAPYCAAKFATIGFGEAIRAELARDGIHVLTVVPGLMRTGSHVHARFKGEHDREYGWFAAGATAPVVSIDTDRAARRIVAAIARGEVELSFTPEARLAPVLRTLMPRLWSELMALGARMLPAPPLESPRTTAFREGLDIERTSQSRLVEVVRQRGRKFAERHAQLGGATASRA